MFLIIAFKKSFENITLVPCFELFGHEHKFKTWFENFLGIFFLIVIWKSFYFLVIMKQLIE
jgi:hypothetical protein